MALRHVEVDCLYMPFMCFLSYKVQYSSLNILFRNLYFCIKTFLATALVDACKTIATQLGLLWHKFITRTPIWFSLPISKLKKLRNPGRGV